MANRLSKLILKELSLVDRPANVESVVTIFKCADSLPEKIAKHCISDDYQGAKSFAEIMACKEARQKYWKAQDTLYPLMDALSESIQSVVADAAMTTNAKEDTIRSNVEAFMMKLRDTLPDAEEALTKFAEDIISGALTKEDSTMADKTVADLEAELAKSQEKADFLELMAKATDGEKDCMKEMDDGKKKEFMNMKPEDRANKMRITKAADEVLIVEGNEVRKSAVGDGVFAVLKSQQKRLDEQAIDVKKAQEEAEMATLRKRADDEYGNLPGTTDERASILKAMGSMNDDVRKSLETVLKAGDTAIKAGFTKFGTSAGILPGSATEELDNLTKAYAKEHNVSSAMAYDAVIQKHADLYDRVLKEGN